MLSNEPLRIFFAINLPDHIKDQIGLLLEDLHKEFNNDIRWVKPHSLHITLQFLKTFQEADLPALISRVSEKIATAYPFQINLDQLELFPSERRPNIISAGVPEMEELKLLSLSLGQALSELNYAIEQRPFRAHLTLGRVNRLMKRPEYNLVDTQHIFPLTFTASELILYRSRPELAPSHYISLHTFPFPLKIAPN